MAPQYYHYSFVEHDDGDVQKLSHFAIPVNTAVGFDEDLTNRESVISLDWSPYSNPSRALFDMWENLGFLPLARLSKPTLERLMRLQ